MQDFVRVGGVDIIGKIPLILLAKFKFNEYIVHNILNIYTIYKSVYFLLIDNFF